MIPLQFICWVLLNTRHDPLTVYMLGFTESPTQATLPGNSDVHVVYLPRFETVLSSVMYVPPMIGSLTLAWNAIWDTNILYTNT